MRRPLLIIAVVAALGALGLAAGCGGGASSNSPTPAASGTDKTPVTLTVWHPWTNPEKKVFETAIQGFTQKYPWIKLMVVGFPDSSTFDQQLIKAINASP